MGGWRGEEGARAPGQSAVWYDVVSFSPHPSPSSRLAGVIDAPAWGPTGKIDVGGGSVLSSNREVEQWVVTVWSVICWSRCNIGNNSLNQSLHNTGSCPNCPAAQTPDHVPLHCHEHQRQAYRSTITFLGISFTLSNLLKSCPENTVINLAIYSFFHSCRLECRV